MYQQYLTHSPRLPFVPFLFSDGLVILMGKKKELSTQVEDRLVFTYNALAPRASQVCLAKVKNGDYPCIIDRADIDEVGRKANSLNRGQYYRIVYSPLVLSLAWNNVTLLFSTATTVSKPPNGLSARRPRFRFSIAILYIFLEKWTRSRTMLISIRRLRPRRTALTWISLIHYGYHAPSFIIYRFPSVPVP